MGRTIYIIKGNTIYCSPALGRTLIITGREVQPGLQLAEQYINHQFISKWPRCNIWRRKLFINDRIRIISLPQSL